MWCICVWTINVEIYDFIYLFYFGTRNINMLNKLTLRWKNIKIGNVKRGKNYANFLIFGLKWCANIICYRNIKKKWNPWRVTQMNYYTQFFNAFFSFNWQPFFFFIFLYFFNFINFNNIFFVVCFISNNYCIFLLLRSMLQQK